LRRGAKPGRLQWTDRNEEIEMRSEAAMLPPSCAAADRSVALAPSGLLKGVRDWLGRRSCDARDRYLSQAVDHVDLELRVRAWQDQELRDARLSCGGVWLWPE
jgi:hypothetical protein